MRAIIVGISKPGKPAKRTRSDLLIDLSIAFLILAEVALIAWLCWRVK